MHYVVIILLALLIQPAPLTLTNSISRENAQRGTFVTLTIESATTEAVTIVQPIDQARFSVEAIYPEPSDHLGQLGHTPYVHYQATGPIKLWITLRVLDDAPPGLVTLTTQASTAEKIPVYASTIVRVGYIYFIP